MRETTKAAISFKKTKVCYFSGSSPEEKYFKFLTNYDANFVVNQIERSRSVNNLKRILKKKRSLTNDIPSNIFIIHAWLTATPGNQTLTGFSKNIVLNEIL